MVDSYLTKKKVIAYYNHNKHIISINKVCRVRNSKCCFTFLINVQIILTSIYIYMMCIEPEWIHGSAASYTLSCHQAPFQIFAWDDLSLTFFLWYVIAWMYWWCLDHYWPAHLGVALVWDLPWCLNEKSIALSTTEVEYDGC